MNFNLSVFKNNKVILLYQTLQLILITALIYFLNIEQELGMAYLFVIFCLFFPLHALAPVQYKSVIQQLWFLVVLFVFLSPVNALKVLLVSGILMAILFSSLQKKYKIGLLLSLTIYLFLCRFGFIYSWIPSNALTVIAGIFMFRAIIYLYDSSHGAEPKKMLDRIAYFFLAPNIIFPLFPIVDLKVFQQNKYNIQGHLIYQRGINLITWGILCLLCYRVIYYYALPDVFKLKGLFNVLQYLIASYLTVIRLIGILSISVGILRMVGYNLPEIFNSIFLASSFSDLFRRINIYWKDFMMKLVYYPVYFKLRKRNVKKHLVTFSLIITFFLTWFFHIYQWSWILGSNPIRLTGLIYWGVFGALAVWGTFNERNSSNEVETSLVATIKKMFHISLVFLGMCLLYTIWINASLSVWWNTIRIAFLDGPMIWIKAIAIYSAVVISGGLIGFGINSIKPKLAVLGLKARYVLAPIALLSLGILWLQLKNNTDPGIKQYLENVTLNYNDLRQQNEGYYESILRADISSKLWDDGLDLALIKQKDWISHLFLNTKDKMLNPVSEAESQQERDDRSRYFQNDRFLNYRFKPNLNTTYKAKPLHTNAEGFRDKEYTKKRAPNTTRIILIGGSPDVGYGVDNDELYEVIIEQTLNKELIKDSLEIINLSLVDLGLLSKVYILESIAIEYNPDYVMLVEHFDDADRENSRLDRIVRKDIEIYPALKKELQRINITEEDIRLRQIDEQKVKFLISWGYHYFARTCTAHGIKPILVYIPIHGNASTYDDNMKMFKGSEFQFIDLKNIYEVFPIDQIRLSVKDNHPNALGHRIIVHGLEPEFRKILKMEK